MSATRFDFGLRTGRLPRSLKSMNATSSTGWVYLEPKPGSAYRQLFVKGTRIMARILYGMHLNEEEPRSPEEIAAPFGLPVEAVREAIVYCQSNPPEIREDYDREEANVKRAWQVHRRRPSARSSRKPA
jgi:uncharacterized protein (DUF433 family)